MQTQGEEQGVGAYTLFNFGSQRPLPYEVKLSVARQPLEMENDTGASLSVISDELYNSLFSAGKALQLVQSGIVLRTYTEEEVKPKGSCSVSVCVMTGLNTPGHFWL